MMTLKTLSLAALSVPMYIFYEVSIVIGHLLTRRRRGWVPAAVAGVVVLATLAGFTFNTFGKLSVPPKS